MLLHLLHRYYRAYYDIGINFSFLIQCILIESYSNADILCHESLSYS